MKLSSKISEIIVFFTVAVMYIAVCAEADIYVSAFPDMVRYFKVEESQIQLILSVNFISLCLAGMICGPFSDVYGYRKVLLFGLLFFVITSVGCIVAESFWVLILWRLLQGAAASVPMVVGGAIFIHMYPSDKAGKMTGLINGIICSAMSAAPIVGTILNVHFGWRANFVAILVLAVISLAGTYLFIEDQGQQKGDSLHFKKILKDYYKLTMNFKFFAYSLIVTLPFTGIVVYVANFSLISINYLNIRPDIFAYYQASTMISFVIFSFVSPKLIAAKGLSYTKKFGLFLTTIGGSSLLATAMYNPNSINFICVSMAIFAAGSSFLPGTFGIEALNIFPDIKGTASAMLTFYRQVMAAGLIFCSGFFFNGSIIPIAITLFVFMIVCLLLLAINTLLTM